MNVVDLFCGEGATSESTGWGAAFWDRGHDVFSVDLEAAYEPSLVADILEVHASDFPWQADVILASPPCQGFSVARIRDNWDWREPTSAKAKLGVELVKATLRIIDEASPKFFIIENPRGMMRTLKLLEHVERRYITYCQYGRFEQKPTDLWGGFPPSLTLKAACGPGATCHDSAPSGSYVRGLGVQGLHDRLAVTAIPYKLSWDVCVAAEKDLDDVRKVQLTSC